MAHYDESHWYGYRGWSQLRRQVTDFAVQLLPLFSDALLIELQEPATAARLFVNTLVEEIGSVVQNRFSEKLAVIEDCRKDDSISSPFNYSSTMWRFALPLFGDFDPLVAAFVKDAEIIKGTRVVEITPEQAIGASIGRFLENSRRKASPVSEQRLKNWEAIDRVSLSIANADTSIGTPLAMRASDEHVFAVFEKLKQEYSTNHNYPIRKLGLLWAYFEEFLPECQIRFEEGSAYEVAISELAAETSADHIRILAGQYCLDQLKGEKPHLFEVLAIEGRLPEANEERISTYIARNGISRSTFKNRYAEGAYAILECLEKLSRYSLRGPQLP